jgi:hypothetical protein
VRLQLRLTEAAEQLFTSIMGTLGIPAKDVILDALGLLHFAVTEVMHGRKIGSYDPEHGEFSAWTTPTLEALKARNRTAAAAAAPQRALSRP